MEWTTIYSVTYPADAYVIQPALENEGFKVFLKDELTVQVDNFMSNAIGGIKIQVPKDQALEAYNFLVEKELIQVSEKSEGFVEKFTKNIPIIKNWSILSRTFFIGVIIIFFLLLLIVMNSPDFS